MVQYVFPLIWVMKSIMQFPLSDGMTITMLKIPWEGIQRVHGYSKTAGEVTGVMEVTDTLSYNTPFLSDLYNFYHAFTFVFNKYDEILLDGLLKNYQYDYSGVTDYICSDGYIYYSNKFYCNQSDDFDEVLVGFSTYFKYPTNYTVSLYINGNLKLSQCGFSEAGYYTIPFDKLYDIERGDEFVIEIINHNDGENYAPVCQADETTIANVLPNTSFVSFDGEKWLDLYELKRFNDFLYNSTKLYTSQVACIKAFTCWYERIFQNIFM